jgi:hypothetical protein
MQPLFADTKVECVEYQARRTCTRAEEKEILARQHHTCATIPGYDCYLKGQPFDEASFQIDHIIELHSGGSNDMSNLQALCPCCHAVKTRRNRKRPSNEAPVFEVHTCLRCEKPYGCERQLMEHMLWHTREDLKRKEKELEKEAKRKEKEQRQREKQESKASKAKEVDKIAEFLCENIVPSDSVINPVSRTEMRRAFKNWKDENDQRGLLFVDMEKRLIKLFGEYPAGGWTNFQLNT